MGNWAGHFRTVCRHKFYVMRACFKCGLYGQGLLHDMSKFGRIEFGSSARYFQGTSSPINAEKIARGYSPAWQHHKGKNRHHWEYWTDFYNRKLIVLRMPPKYLMEMVCDWVGAGKAYNKGHWTIDTFREWYAAHRQKMVLHPHTLAYIEDLVANAKDERDLFKNWLVKEKIEKSYAALPFCIPRYRLVPAEETPDKSRGGGERARDDAQGK